MLHGKVWREAVGSHYTTFVLFCTHILNLILFTFQKSCNRSCDWELQCEFQFGAAMESVQPCSSLPLEDRHLEDTTPLLNTLCLRSVCMARFSALKVDSEHLAIMLYCNSPPAWMRRNIRVCQAFSYWQEAQIQIWTVKAHAESFWK